MSEPLTTRTDDVLRRVNDTNVSGHAAAVELTALARQLERENAQLRERAHTLLEVLDATPMRVDGPTYKALAHAENFLRALLIGSQS